MLTDPLQSVGQIRTTYTNEEAAPMLGMAVTRVTFA